MNNLPAKLWEIQSTDIPIGKISNENKLPPFISGSVQLPLNQSGFSNRHQSERDQ
jgi:hypothetical protein